MNTIHPTACRYPYDEFADHIRAMRTVKEWEYTSRFGHVGHAQTNSARSARVIEYFTDSYADSKEAVYKAGIFLTVHDYIGRHLALFIRKDLVEEAEPGSYLVEPNLLRAVHHAFITLGEGAVLPPQKILNLARAFREIECC